MSSTINPLVPQPHKIVSITKHTDKEFTFRIRCDADPNFGQFFMLSLPTIGEAPISASGKGPGFVEFTIRNVGLLTNAIFELEPGKSIFLRGPYGTHFPVKQFEHKDLVVIVGGTGMAPVMTMLNHFYDHPEICKSVNIIAGFRTYEDVLFREEIKKFQSRFNMMITLYREEKEGYLTGMVNNHIGKIPFNTFNDYNIVIVGGGTMMRYATTECANLGLDESKIWVSYERKMCCGVGKCGHCKINDSYVCLDGPVYNYLDAKERLLD